jgi:hypothetical protein
MPRRKIAERLTRKAKTPKAGPKKRRSRQEVEEEKIRLAVEKHMDTLKPARKAGKMKSYRFKPPKPGYETPQKAHGKAHRIPMGVPGKPSVLLAGIGDSPGLDTLHEFQKTHEHTKLKHVSTKPNGRKVFHCEDCGGEV